MLQWLCDNYYGEIQLSFGMTTHEEENEIINLFEKNVTGMFCYLLPIFFFFLGVLIAEIIKDRFKEKENILASGDSFDRMYYADCHCIHAFFLGFDCQFYHFLCLFSSGRSFPETSW